MGFNLDQEMTRGGGKRERGRKEMWVAMDTKVAIEDTDLPNWSFACFFTSLDN